MPITVRSLIAILILWAAEPCSAATVVDPSGDILSTYVGPVGSDLDILQFTAETSRGRLSFQRVARRAPGTTALVEIQHWRRPRGRYQHVSRKFASRGITRRSDKFYARRDCGEVLTV